MNPEVAKLLSGAVYKWIILPEVLAEPLFNVLMQLTIQLSIVREEKIYPSKIREH